MLTLDDFAEKILRPAVERLYASKSPEEWVDILLRSGMDENEVGALLAHIENKKAD